MPVYNSFKIVLDESANAVQRKLAIELAGILGFESISMGFPVVELRSNIVNTGEYFYINIKSSASLKVDINIVEDGLDLLVPNDESVVKTICKSFMEDFDKFIPREKSSHECLEKPTDFVSSSETTYPVGSFDRRKQKGLESLFNKDYLLEDKDGDFLPDYVRAKIKMKSGDIWETVAGANIAARYGMETLGYKFPIIARENNEENLIVIENGGKPVVKIADAEKKIIYVTGKDSQLGELSANLCQNHPKLTTGHEWIDFINSLIDAVQIKNIDGQFAFLGSHKENIGKDTKCYFSPSVDRMTKLKEMYPNINFCSYKGISKVYEEEYDIPWEVDVCKDIVREKLLPLVNNGDTVEIQTALSEDKLSRDKVSKFLDKEIKAKGANTKNIEVICAYKQGFSWLDEVIIPKIKATGKTPTTIEVFFKPFLPKGVTEWSDENGATPQITSAREDNPNKWFDLPVRYLQELYPIDDIIAQKLGIDRQNIKFTSYDGDEDLTYFVLAKGEDGKEILKGTYKAECSERKYIDEFPGVGLVHPSTGYIRAKINGKLVLIENIPTDLEQIWNIYQSKILPYCKEYALKKSGGNPVNSMQPFFSQLRLDIEVSEPDYNLPCREDMISSINSLHEDIYFVGLDFFKIFGTRTTECNLDAPGLILPVIKKSEGKPKFKFTLLDQNYNSACINSNGEKLVTNIKREDIEAFVSEISQSENGWKAVISLKSSKNIQGIIKEYALLLEKGVAEVNGLLLGVEKLTFSIEDCGGISNISANMGAKKNVEIEQINIEDIDLMENKLIGYDDYIRIINQLKRVKGISVYRIAESYQGRKIHAIELLPDYKGYVSRTKLININPVEYINGRHHANEVSSTNSAFMLLKELLTNPKYKDLPNKLNLVLVPFENADGAAIHYELQKDNPNWKLHIARFNSLGKEIAYEYFNDDTIHTEAHAFTQTWRRWLPDVITDNHGVPSHEWDQQFSGYTSPWFKGFWMPRALLYSYFFHIKDDRYIGNYKLNKAMEDVVAESMRSDEEISRWNKDWQNRFEKYAHEWMPKLFPADYYKDMISYWIPAKYSADHRYAAVRYPWITAVSFVSEVSDETAQGEYLKLCARAHARHDLAVLDMLIKTKCLYEVKLIKSDDEYTKIRKRIRPIFND